MMTKQGGSVAIIVIVLAVLALLGGGYYWSKTNTNSSGQNTNSNPINTVTGASSQNASDEKSELVTRCSKENRKIAGLKALNAFLVTYLNDHDSYPKSLDNPDQYQTGGEYLYAYYPATNPKHYHIGVRIELFPDCGDIIQTRNLTLDSDFDSKKDSYVNGFSGVDPVYDLTDYQQENRF